MLNHNGVLILSVPTFDISNHLEHFPLMDKYEIIKYESDYLLVTKEKGVYKIYNKLIFHGGPGTTLEMRKFSHLKLINDLKIIGFSKVITLEQAIPDNGIYWPHYENILDSQKEISDVIVCVK
jgi:hypothetical protein